MNRSPTRVAQKRRRPAGTLTSTFVVALAAATVASADGGTSALDPLVGTGSDGVPVAPASRIVTLPGEPMLAEALPSADAGECYAKVTVPASFRLEPVEVIVRDASQRFEIVPARVAARTKRVTTRDAATAITAIQPTMRKDTQTIEHRPARTRWVRDGLDGTLVPGASEFANARAAGIDIDAIEPGLCVVEYYKADPPEITSKRVLVREATEELSVEPARWVEERQPIVTQAAQSRLVEIPAVWRETEEQVLVEPASTTWKLGKGLIERIDEVSGEIMCRVDVPARYEAVKREIVETPAMVTRLLSKEVLATIDVTRLERDALEVRTPVAAVFDTVELTELPAPGEYVWTIGEARPLEPGFEKTGRSLCRTEVPAVSVTYEREVLAEGGRFVHEMLPADYEEIEIVEVVADASSEAIEVPAVTETLTRRTRLSDAHIEWQPVLCETNVTPDVVRRLQSALDDAGHSPRGIDGLLGSGTLAAVDAYQTVNGLAQGGLTLETFRHLGVGLHISTLADTDSDPNR